MKVFLMMVYNHAFRLVFAWNLSRYTKALRKVSWVRSLASSSLPVKRNANDLSGRWNAMSSLLKSYVLIGYLFCGFVGGWTPCKAGSVNNFRGREQSRPLIPFNPEAARDLLR